MHFPVPTLSGAEVISLAASELLLPLKNGIIGIMNSIRLSSLLFLLLLIAGSCGQESVDPVANIILDGAIHKGTNANRMPTVSGYVKNIGQGTGYRGRIAINGLKSWNNSIVTAVDISLNGGNPIPSGARIAFEAILPNITSHYDYDYLTSEIKWERNNLSPLSGVASLSAVVVWRLYLYV